MNNFIDDIFAVPQALRQAVAHFPVDTVKAIKDRIESGEYDRILISGMGASMFVSISTLAHLNGLDLPVFTENSGELCYQGKSQIGKNTLLWLNSQSGRSVEIIKLLDALKDQPPKTIVATVNDADSPLAQAADYPLVVHAGSESVVSVKTFCNMLAVNIMTALILKGADFEPLKQQALRVADLQEEFLNQWDQKKTDLDKLLADFKNLFILGRGASFGTAKYGALVGKESIRTVYDSMHGADFRHGPLELVQADLSAVILAGDKLTRKINQTLAEDILKLGGNVVWVDGQADNTLPTLKIPYVEEWTIPLFEMLAMLLLAVVIADRKGYQPGHFRHISKVTTKE